MADETTAVVATTPEGAEKAIATDAGADTSAATTEGAVPAATVEAKTFTQADLDRIVKDRLDKAKAQAEKQTEAARLEAERKAAEEQGEYKKLYDAEVQARTKAEQEAATERRERLLDRIATEHKLPDALRGRLQGDDEEALRADAEALAKLMAPATPNAPNLDATARGVVAPGAVDDAKQAELRQRFRLGSGAVV